MEMDVENKEEPTINKQQHKVELGEVVFSSEFDSGNLGEVIQTGDAAYDVYVIGDYFPDRPNGVYNFWYYFSVTGITPNKLVNFTFRNIGYQERLFSFGFRPVVKVGSKPWHRISSKFEYFKKEGEHFAIRFEHLFDYEATEITYFALTFPHSYTDCQSLLESFEKAYKSHPSVYFHRERLVKSIEERRVDLVTITGRNDQLEEREPEIKELESEEETRPFKFNKPTIFLTARVHPAETQGSHMVNGFFNFLLYNKKTAPASHQLIANILLRKFVFKIIPMLNPDGVSRGFYRLDSLGQNLNRYYTTIKY